MLMGKLKTRKNIRLKTYDYSQNGMYFITICTQNRKEILSKIIPVWGSLMGDPLTTPQPQTPKCNSHVKIQLTREGQIIQNNINNINENYKNIIIDEYVIMPNHVHLIVKIVLPCGMGGSPMTASPTGGMNIPKLMNSFKSIVVKQIGYSVWQRGYYEHIVRNKKEYQKIREYIKNNPKGWKNVDKGDIEMAEKKNKILKEARQEVTYLTGDAEVKRLAELRENWNMERIWDEDLARKEGIKQRN